MPLNKERCPTAKPPTATVLDGDESKAGTQVKPHRK
jgi:hypothetical protein